MFQRRSRNAIWALVSVILSMSSVGSVVALDKYPPEPNVPASEMRPYDSIGYPLIDWPTWWGLQQTGQVDASFSSWGTFGRGADRVRTTYSSWPKGSFQSPSGSGKEYLYAGAVWVGGIVGTDTLVSVGFDGWQLAADLYPPAGPSGKTAESVTSFPYATSFSMRAEFTDTINADQSYQKDIISNRPHTPLNVRIANRSHVWHDPVFNNCVVYDMVITNIGQQDIHQGYVGFYMDADVGGAGRSGIGYDDVTGYLSDAAVAYIIDNYGEPGMPVPVPSAFAFKVLHTSFPTEKLSYNWWVTNSLPSDDFGPMRKDHYRDFGTGGTGTPEGDANKYFLMSNGEIDYDQIMTALLTPADSGTSDWLLPPQVLARTLTLRCDTKFLYSVGPFELPPDSSVRIVYTTFAGGTVHTDANNFKNNLDSTYNPLAYLANLHFDEMRAYAKAADSVAGLFLYNPLNPPIGLTARRMGEDSAYLSWDPWVYPGVDGYELSYAEIPKSAYMHPGVVPIWYKPTSSDNTITLGPQREYVLSGLSQHAAYSVTLRNRVGSSLGSESEPALITWTTPLPAPQFTDTIALVRGSAEVTIRWHPPSSGPVDHYNVYKFTNSASAAAKYSRQYLRYRAPGPADSVLANKRWYYYYALPVYQQVGAEDTVFTDSEPPDGTVFAVTAVDTAGFESGFSQDFRVYRVAEISKGILVMSNSTSYVPYNYVTPDSITSFYNRALSPYGYDFYNFNDTCWARGHCIDWRELTPYQVVIVDDGMHDHILSDTYEDARYAFDMYLRFGGILVYCGSLSYMSGTPVNWGSHPGWYFRGQQFVKEYFGIDSVYYVGWEYYYRHSTAPYVDSILGFSYAEPTTGLAQLGYDTGRYPFDSSMLSLWPASSPPSVSVFRHDTTVAVTHLFRSLVPSQSRVEGLPVGLHKKTANSDAWVFGFHFWYMNEEDVSKLINQIYTPIPVVTDVANEAITPAAATTLLQNSPNPFNPSTTIRYSLVVPSDVRLEIFNILGQKVRILFEGVQSAGEHTLIWNGRSDGGQDVASGIYLYRLSAGSSVLARKMLLLK